jgi:hypothetical protein
MLRPSLTDIQRPPREVESESGEPLQGSPLQGSPLQGTPLQGMPPESRSSASSSGELPEPVDLLRRSVPEPHEI